MKAEKATKRLWNGKVISDAMDKTIVVETVRTLKHPFFGKILKKVKRYKVHDPKESAKVGDVVEFVEGRPVSKTKYMYLTKVISQQTV